ncbi:hypothetical protein M3212_13130 [Alkalihalobacillus oceani]|uniref:hypothetical protein n=1 Tax=Halalkalibacter oceani TaxID=1653776 RepID=UPI00203D162F|nr:hypothetical protein [Halalkalibacter oceani]MCM3761715.1 hypothetical protein [Halalkalibacter oceani]
MLWPLGMVITLSIIMVGSSVPYMVKHKFSKKEWILFGLLAAVGVSLNLILSLQGQLPDPLKALDWLVQLVK